jgi:dihydrofolate synthase/folylpolyglutamate synthase
MNRLISVTGIEGFRPKLEHIRELLSKEVKEIEESGTKVVVIGGTNGKGGTSHALRYLLEKEGKKVSLWTSPHVLSILERFIIDSEYLSYDELEGLLDECESVIRENHLSFYEALVLILLKKVAKTNSDYLILEVGLGGRFDAVNIFTNPLCAITSISLDHTEILGNSLKEILFEKYGITRIGGKLYSHVEQKFLQESLVQWCERDHIDFVQLEDDDYASYEKRNQKLALALYKELEHRDALPPFEWPRTKGRREKVTFRSRDFIFIGAHNLDGHRKMLKMLKDEAIASKDDILVMSFSTGREEQIDKILSLYKTYPCLFSSKYMTSFESIRAISKSFLHSKVNDEYSYLEDWNTLLDDKYKNRKIIVTGSYFFIAEIQKYFDMFNRS